ncbi:hypothetical protein PVAP13_7NG437401 [Panicum virgatum]|uniref:Uncharacterized protein n=1 Tax=Panicum virgatum TaxID=38727 RepID=A0A8T0Q751_PANVG|nr:hypothetical protein PVAP13_7NG437401 [Panicum virgatum]
MVSCKKENTVGDSTASTKLKRQQSSEATREGWRRGAIPSAVAGAQLQPLEAPALPPQPSKPSVAGADAAKRQPFQRQRPVVNAGGGVDEGERLEVRQELEPAERQGADGGEVERRQAGQGRAGGEQRGGGDRRIGQEPQRGEPGGGRRGRDSEQHGVGVPGRSSSGDDGGRQAEGQGRRGGPEEREPAPGNEGHGRRGGRRQEAEHLLQQVVAERGVRAGVAARATAAAAA